MAVAWYRMYKEVQKKVKQSLDFEYSIALAASQSIDPIVLVLVYVLSVTAALIGITVICMKFYERFQYKVIHPLLMVWWKQTVVNI
jgi:hypothetical protein